MGGTTKLLTTRPWQPSAPLRGSLVSMFGYEMVLDTPTTHRGLPTAELTFVLPIDAPLQVGWHGRGDTRRALWSCVSGLDTQPAEIFHAGQQAGIQIALSPQGARQLFGVPCGVLQNTLVELDDIAPDLADLPDQLASVTDWRERLQITETRLLEAASGQPAAWAASEVVQARRRLAQGHPVAAVAAEVGWSRRHLSARFNAEYGLTPKRFQRLARFARSARLLKQQVRAGSYELATIAALCGYADQAHLTREWQSFAGSSPTAWLHAEFPFLQDSIDLPPAD